VKRIFLPDETIYIFVYYLLSLVVATVNIMMKTLHYYTGSPTKSDEMVNFWLTTFFRFVSGKYL